MHKFWLVVASVIGFGLMVATLHKELEPLLDVTDAVIHSGALLKLE